MYVEGIYYSISAESASYENWFDDHDDHNTTFYVSRCNIKNYNGVVVGYVSVPKICDRDHARKYLFLAVERMMTAKTLVLEEVPVFIECEGLFCNRNRRVIGRRI